MAPLLSRERKWRAVKRGENKRKWVWLATPEVTLEIVAVLEFEIRKRGKREKESRCELRKRESDREEHWIL